MERKHNENMGQLVPGESGCSAQEFFLEYPIETIDKFFEILKEIPSPEREDVFIRFCLRGFEVEK